MAEYVLNHTLEVIPAGGDRLELRVPLLGRRIEGTRYQVGLLQRFEDASTIDGVLEAYPFHRDSSRAFLERSVEAGVLLAVVDGQTSLPTFARATPGFANAPAFDPAAPAPFAFLGVPYDRNTTGHAGAKFGPHVIRGASEGCRYRLDPNTFAPIGFHDYASGRRLLEGIALADAGDVFIAPGEPDEAIFRRITRAVEEIVEAGAIPLVMGGDHSITFPVLRALPAARVGVLHLDAHTDLGESMPGAGIHHGNVFSVVLDKLEYVEHLTQVGLRGLLDASEHQPSDLVTQIGIDALRERGVEAVVEATDPSLPYYLSLDIDVVDPSFAPATGTPVPNGLHPHELKRFLRCFAERREVIGMDVVEVAQPSGSADGTPGLAAEALLTVADAIVRGLQRKLQGGDTPAEGEAE